MAFTKASPNTDHGRSRTVLHSLLNYPPPNSLKLKSTSWLDGVRGTAALGVYIFHAMGCWASLVPAWHSDELQTNPLQLPFIRTFFVSGGAAVSVFFALSGYVLTHKSLSWMRNGRRDEIRPAVASSLFRRGFRLYLPPILVTFFEMLSTRFGYAPPLNFYFEPAETFCAQFLNWVAETNRLVNPAYNWKRAMQGFITHPKYDAVIWTIPLEFYGSLVCYALLFLLALVPGNKIRMVFVAGFAVISMMLGSWNLSCFSSGMLIADFNLSQDSHHSILSLPKPPRHQKLWLAIFTAAFYVAGFPSLGYGSTAASKPMPGFETLFALTPTSPNLEEPARFMWSLSGAGLLLSISQVPKLKKVFETDFCQYIGRISFSLYLVHEFCLVLFGLAFQAFLLRIAGLKEDGAEGSVAANGGLMYCTVCGVWFLWFTVAAFAIAAQVEKWVDVPSVRFARWLEEKCKSFTRHKHISTAQVQLRL